MGEGKDQEFWYMTMNISKHLVHKHLGYDNWSTTAVAI